MIGRAGRATAIAVAAAATGPGCTIGRRARRDAAAPPVHAQRASAGPRRRAARTAASGRSDNAGHPHPHEPTCAPARWAAHPPGSARAWSATAPSPTSETSAAPTQSAVLRGGARWYPAGSSAASARRRALASGRRARTGLDGRATVQVANVAALRLRVRLGGLCQSEGAIGVPWIAPRSAARRRARAGHMRAGARRHSPAAVAPRRGGRCAPGRSPAVPSQPYGKSDRNRRAVAALRLTRPVRQTPGRTRGAARSGRVRPEAAQPTTPRPWWRTQIAGELRSDPALPGVRIHGSGSHCWNDALAAAARTANPVGVGRFTRQG